ncbi:enterocin 1071A family bacteriocin [Enterococcus faecalis]|uniref:enterocin 1071A family bacteriocin n=1 Tax=Enterococcus faecalis TaxID=1351 RepID=UPI0019EAFA4F|nr:bacteriocin [Enterococcus faecalis]
MKKYKVLNEKEMKNTIGGGKKDYDFGHNVGKTIHDGAVWLWKNTLGSVEAH